MIRWMLAVFRSFRPAFAGLNWSLRTQRNLRVHATASVAVLLLGLWLRLENWEWCAVLLATGLVWSAELLNTALEALADRVTSGRDEAIRRVKDAAAAAVLTAASAAALVGALVFLPKLWRCFENVPPPP